MDPDKKADAPQAPAQETKPDEAKSPAGLDGFNKEQLMALYKKSPQMFEEAGIVKKEVPPTPEPPKSAALAMDGVEIKLPADFENNRAVVESYLAHAKEIGLSPKQVQAEIDFQAKRAREVMAAQPKPKTPVELQAEADAVNVGKLKQEFGTKYDENMDVARRAAAKYGDPELLARLNTSDPVLVKHFLKIGKADAEDTTNKAPNRNGNETEDAEAEQAAYMKRRYPNTPSMFNKA